MEHYYGAAQNGDQKWVVSVNGENVLVCTRKTDAVKAAKEATRLLTQPTAPIRMAFPARVQAAVSLAPRRASAPVRDGSADPATQFGPAGPRRVVTG